MVRARASAKDANKREKSIEKEIGKGNPTQGKIQWNILTLNNLAYLSGMSVPILVSLDGSSESDEKLILLGSAACLRDAQALLTSNHMLYESAAPLIVSRARRFLRRLLPFKTGHRANVTRQGIRILGFAPLVNNGEAAGDITQRGLLEGSVFLLGQTGASPPGCKAGSDAGYLHAYNVCHLSHARLQTHPTLFLNKSPLHHLAGRWMENKRKERIMSTPLCSLNLLFLQPTHDSN